MFLTEHLEFYLVQDRTIDSLKVELSNTTPTVVYVSRPADVEKTRKDLPIVMMEQEIMEAINYHLTVIICGETGCGKTTQVPQVRILYFIPIFLGTF